jgi:hypothetical protein
MPPLLQQEHSPSNSHLSPEGTRSITQGATLGFPVRATCTHQINASHLLARARSGIERNALPFRFAPSQKEEIILLRVRTGLLRNKIKLHFLCSAAHPSKGYQCVWFTDGMHTLQESAKSPYIFLHSHLPGKCRA